MGRTAISGFAVGRVAMSFRAWVLEPQLAAVLSVFGSLTGQIIAAFTVRREFHWKSLLPFIAGGLAGGFLVGIVEAVSSQFLDGYWANLIIFGLLLAVLLS